MNVYVFTHTHINVNKVFRFSFRITAVYMCVRYVYPQHIQLYGILCSVYSMCIQIHITMRLQALTI